MCTGTIELGLGAKMARLSQTGFDTNTIAFEAFAIIAGGFSVRTRLEESHMWCMGGACVCMMWCGCARDGSATPIEKGGEERTGTTAAMRYD